MLLVKQKYRSDGNRLLNIRSFIILPSGEGLTSFNKNSRGNFSDDNIDNIVSDPNHKLKALLPPDYDNSRYNLRRQSLFNMPKLCTNRTSNTVKFRK